MNKDYKGALDDLQFSGEAKNRMTRNLVAAQAQKHVVDGGAANDRPSAYATRGGKFRWRYAAAAVAAVVLVMGIGGGAYASGALMSMGNVMDDLFGGPPAATEVVDKVGKPLGASASSAGVTVTTEAIIGDTSNYAVVFSVAKDDGSAFEGIEASDSGALPIIFDGPWSLTIDGVYGGGGGGAYFYDADPTDNAIQFVEKMSIGGTDETIIGKTARAHFTNLHVLGESEADNVMLAAGTWNLKFQIDYEDTSVQLVAGQPFNLNGMHSVVDAVSISPLAITVDYTTDEVMQFEQQESGKMSDRNAAESAKFEVPIRITLNDGTVIESVRGGASHRSPDGDKMICRTSVIFDEFVDVDSVTSVTIGDVIVPMA